MEEGEFEILDGTGQRLAMDENPYEDPAQRMAHRILRNNGFAPAWIEESRELDRDIEHLEKSRERYTAEEYRRRVDQLNRRITNYNLKTPVAIAQKRILHA